MNNPMVIDRIDKLIALIDRSRNIQIVANQIYAALKYEIISEMNENIPIASSAKLNKRLKPRKLHRMDRLTVLHKHVDSEERKYIKFKGVRQHKIRLHAEYKTAVHIFHKKLRIQIENVEIR